DAGVEHVDALFEHDVGFPAAEELAEDALEVHAHLLERLEEEPLALAVDRLDRLLERGASALQVVALRREELQSRAGFRELAHGLHVHRADLLHPALELAHALLERFERRRIAQRFLGLEALEQQRFLDGQLLPRAPHDPSAFSSRTRRRSATRRVRPSSSAREREASTCAWASARESSSRRASSSRHSASIAESRVASRACSRSASSRTARASKSSRSRRDR